MALTKEDQRAGGRASAAKRLQRIAERAELAQVVDPILDGLQRERVGPKLLQMALHTAEAAQRCTITPETPLEFKQMIEAATLLHKMARLELGESTSNSATFDVTDRDAQLAKMRERIAELDAEA